METPRKQKSKVSRRYTTEEKAQILANFDLEGAHPCKPKRLPPAHTVYRTVDDKIRRFRTRLEDMLADFLVRHENEITRIPRAIRPMSVAEFGDKYNGSITECLQGLAKVKLDEGIDVDIQASARKR